MVKLPRISNICQQVGSGIFSVDRDQVGSGRDQVGSGLNKKNPGQGAAAGVVGGGSPATIRPPSSRVN